MDGRHWLSIQQVAERFGVSHHTIRREVRAKHIKYLRVGGQIRISLDAIDEYERPGLPKVSTAPHRALYAPPASQSWKVPKPATECVR